MTREELRNLIEEKLGDYLFIVVSNREPYIHTLVGEEIGCIVPASGLTMALDPVMRTCGGIWIAWGSGDGDREMVDSHDRLQVPPEDPRYTLRRVWLSKEEEDGYYYGTSNEALWPLCHVVYTRPTFDEADWEVYKRVNKLFADTILEEVGSRRAFVFIQDYHLTLLSRLIKERNPNIVTAQFWHIPWPNREVFRICPWQEEILDGLLGNDLIGFHVQYYCNNFLECVERALESRVDYSRFAITQRKKTTLVRPFPYSVDFDSISKEAKEKEVAMEIDKLKHELRIRDKIICVGCDRIDYTKGIPERLRALDVFFEKYPEYRERLVFVEFGALSRLHIKDYKEVNDQITHLVEEINWKYETKQWKPIIFLRGHHSQLTLRAAFGMAQVCIVSSLHDGMNLVAKEFVSSRPDEDGVLILSRFTGAAYELTDALLVNPHDIGELAEAIKRAIEMPSEERQARMRRMREVVSEHNIYSWVFSVASELTKLKSRKY